MAGDELVRRVAVAMLAPALGQHEFVLRFQHGKPPDLLEIAGEAGFGRQNRQSRGTGHSSALQSLPPMPRRAKRTAAPRADGANFAATAKLIAAATLQDKRVRKKVNSASRRRDPSVYT